MIYPLENNTSVAGGINSFTTFTQEMQCWCKKVLLLHENNVLLFGINNLKSWVSLLIYSNLGILIQNTKVVLDLTNLVKTLLLRQSFPKWQYILKCIHLYKEISSKGVENIP